MIKYDFDDKVALVTGAGSGIGKGIAEALCKSGATVILNGMENDQTFIDTIEEFKNKKYKCYGIWADVSVEDQVADMFKRVEKDFGRLDYLINCAGIAINHSLEGTTRDTWDKVLEVNLMGKMLCTKHAVKLLKRAKQPRIVNISSRLGTKPMKNSCAYCCSQAGILMLTKCSALELAEFGIKVNAVSPSLTLTPLSLKKYTPEQIEKTAKENPSGRLGEISDTVNAVLFLLCDESEYINGESLEVSGGVLLL